MTPIRTPLCRSVELGPKGTAIAPLPSFRLDTPSGRAVCSVWQPTPEEREAIANGANLMLATWMDPTPPVAIEVRSGSDFEPVTRTTDPTSMQPQAEGQA